MSRRFSLVLGALLAVGASAGQSPQANARAAEPEFVGVLSIVLHERAVERLALSDEQQQKLTSVIDKREAQALELALKLKDLSTAARAEQLRPFREESEKMGLAILSDAQRALLEGVRIDLIGMATLAESAVAEKLLLSAEQSAKIAELLTQRDSRLAKARSQQHAAIRADYERRMGGVLSKAQRAGWEALAAGEQVQLAQVEEPTAERKAEPATGEPAAVQPAPTEPVAEEPPAKVASDAPVEKAAQIEPASASDSATTDNQPGASQPRDDGPGRRGRRSAEPATDSPVESTVPPASMRLRFNFKSQPWEEVIQWFADQAGMSLMMDSFPGGTFNYLDDQSYSIAESLDLLNSILETKGYRLVRRHRVLWVINLEEEIPPHLIPRVPLADLDSRGEFEYIKVLYSLKYVTPDEVEAEITPLLGPQGAVVKLKAARQIEVSSTGGRLRTIRTVIERMENPGGGAESPRLQSYPVPEADPQAVLEALKLLVGERPGVKLWVDAKSGVLNAFGRDDVHETVRATIEQLQSDARHVVVIRLSQVDPQLAVLAINSLFGVDPKNPAATGLKVDAEPTTRQLFVRGSEAQIRQVRAFLKQMGEDDEAASVASSGQKVRMLPLTERQVRKALAQLEAVWPNVRQNKIRIVAPALDAEVAAPSGSSRRRALGDGPPVNEPEAVNSPDENTPRESNPAGDESAEESAPSVDTEPKSPAAESERPATETNRKREKAIPRRRGVKVLTTAYRPDAEANTKSGAEAGETEATGGADAAAPERPEVDLDEASELEPAEIVVAFGPAGVTITSDDVNALDEFEALLMSLTGGGSASNKEFTVFYLRSADVTNVAETLAPIFGGGGGGDGGGGGGGLMGDLANAALGDAAGGLVGNLLGSASASGSITTGPVTIIPDVRLNALLVRASAADLDMIEQLLEVLDQKGAPETDVAPKPRLIPVLNQSANDIANVVRQVYQNRLSTSGGQRQPNPEDFFRMFAGGRGRGNRGGGGGGNDEDSIDKMTIGVDERTNALVVVASQTLFSEVQTLVTTLDQATPEVTQSVRVVTLKRTTPASMKTALAAVVGDQVRSSTTNSTNGNSQGQPGQGGGPGGFPFQRGGFFGQGGGPGGGFGGFGGQGGPGGGFGGQGGPGGGFGRGGFGGGGFGGGGFGGGGFGGPGGGGFGGGAFGAPGGGGQGGGGQGGGGRGGQGGGGGGRRGNRGG